MSATFILITLFQIALVLLLAYGFLHEDKFIKFEDKWIRLFKVYIHKVRKNMTINTFISNGWAESVTAHSLHSTGICMSDNYNGSAA
ncbi:MAG: hypothetical protein LBH71_02770 [Oscillospiraceae bacterium]|jgi:hypothetical protein|nr:hypothetical protein [Oscillospiraceae bacterium]